MKSFISAIAVVLIAGCQSQEELDKIALKKKQSVLIEQCISKLQINLKDPDSMKITVSPNVFTNKEGIETVGFLYNAKNSYGGYAGDEFFFCEFDSNGKITNSH